MVRRSPPHEWANHPELLTSIKSPWDKFRKADWNFGKYEDAIFARPCDPEEVVFSALDFCVAIVSLRDWTRKFFIQDVRQGNKPLPPELSTVDEFTDFVNNLISWQKAIEAIANTVKHAEYRDSGWPNGIAMPASFYPDNLKDEHDDCEDGIELFSFMHKHRNVVWWDIALRQHPENDATPGYVAFGDVLEGWEGLIKNLGYESV
jgi:hypothetical protein